MTDYLSTPKTEALIQRIKATDHKTIDDNYTRIIRMLTRENRRENIPIPNMKFQFQMDGMKLTLINSLMGYGDEIAEYVDQYIQNKIDTFDFEKEIKDATHIILKEQVWEEVKTKLKIEYKEKLSREVEAFLDRQDLHRGGYNE